MKEEYIYLKTGDSYIEGEIYVFKEEYICLMGKKREDSKTIVDIFITKREKSYNGPSVLPIPDNDIEYRLSTKQEKEHLQQCIRHSCYMDYEEHIPSTEELNLLSLIEESKKLSNI